MRKTFPAATATLCLLALALALPASAHLGQLSYSDIAVRGEQVHYRIKFAAHLIPDTGPAMAGRLGRQQVVAMEGRLLAWLDRTLRVSSNDRPCTPTIAELVGPDYNDDLEITLSLSCPGPVHRLRVEFRIFDHYLDDFENVVSLSAGGQSLGYVFNAENRTLIWNGEDGPETATASTAQFFRLGLSHIGSGYDHLLFLLALLLLGGTLKRLAAIVTAFTVAHSLTLAISVLGLLSLPSAPVEVIIALSIVYVAAENLLRTRNDHRWAITFAFGLIHGFAFAGVLGQAGLAPGGLLWPLLGFNAGVEAGQLIVVGAALPLLAWLSHSRHDLRLRRAFSWAILAVGMGWAVERGWTLLSPYW
ncbi:MAG: HupE/UreJ family protein [Deltaproteobacteria bacterium]